MTSLSGDDSAQVLLRDLDAPLTAAGNYVAGVSARAHGLMSTPTAPVEAKAHLLAGIEGAIEQLERAAEVTRMLLSSESSAEMNSESCRHSH